MFELDLPPVFFAVCVAGDQETLGLAKDRAGQAKTLEDGTMFWADHPPLLDCVIALTPEENVSMNEQAVIGPKAIGQAAEIALTDALGSLLPPQLPVQTVVGQIAVDGERIGLVSTHTIQSGQAAGQVLLEIKLPLGLGASMNEKVTLADCGAGFIYHRKLLEVFARQLIHWIGVLEDEGCEALSHAWKARELDHMTPSTAC